MADEIQHAAPGGQLPEQAPADQAPQAAKAPSQKRVQAPPVEEAEVEASAPRQDPMMAQLVAAQRELDTARKELESHRARVKQYERDQRKQAVLSSLMEEFPGLPRNEIRGAALVAAEDGHVDLFSDDVQASVDKLKELLRVKSKAKPPTPNPGAPAPSLGGTPGSPSKPPTPGRKFLI